jgi:hypothetical protein
MTDRVGERRNLLQHRSGRSTAVWASIWLVATAVNLAILLSLRQLGVPSPVTGLIAVLAQVGATIALLRWLGPLPTGSLAAAPSTRRWALALGMVLAVVALFPIGAAGLIVMAPVAAAAGIVLVVLRPRLSGREIAYAAVLGVLALVGGVLESTVSAGTLGTALVQLPLVVGALLAAVAIARRVGWTEAGIGSITYLERGVRPALRNFGIGFVLAAPWALGNIATGPFEEDHFAAGWQVLAALRPGIAEEVWIRAFVITLLYWAFRRYARAHTALLAAALLGTYWFAFLHVPGNPVLALLFAAMQLLAMTFVWLRRGLEAAIGFHVCVDLVRFLAAYLAFSGIWFQ